MKNVLKITSKKQFINLYKKYFSVIGMDIGPTNTCMAILEPTGPRVIENAEGFRLTPSSVTLTDAPKFEEGLFVGFNSKSKFMLEKKNSFQSMSYLFSNDKQLIEKLIASKRFAFDIELEKLEENSKSSLTDKIKLKTTSGKSYDPIIMSSYFLKYCKEQADSLLGKNIKKIVLSIPNYLNKESSKQDLKRSLNLIGLDPISFVDEEKCSILSYGAINKNNILIFNIGGSSMSLSVLKKENSEPIDNAKDTDQNKGKEKEVLSSGKKDEPKKEEIDYISELNKFKLIENQVNYSIGGEDIDNIIINLLVDEFNKKNKADVEKIDYAMQKIYEASEKAKIELTLSNQVEISLPFLTADQTGPKHLNYILSRGRFERFIGTFLDKIKKECEEFKNKVISKDSDFFNKLDDILIVGGISRIPCIQDIIKQVFKKEPNRNINPEEAQTLGACIIADMLKNKSEEKVSFEKLPLSIGIKTLGGGFTRLINKDVELPIEKSFRLSTTYDNQPVINVSFYMGEREIAEDNKLLGEISKKIPLSKKGFLDIECTIHINEKGYMSINLLEKTLSKSNSSYSLDLNNGLNPEILEDVINVSKKFKDVDELRLETAKLRSEIDEFLYTFDKEINKINTEEAETIQKLSSELSQMISVDIEDTESVLNKYDELIKNVEKIVSLKTERNENNKI